MDFKKFEQLNRGELELFVGDLARHGQVDCSILSYYKTRGANLDEHHLQMIVFLLGRLGTNDALREAAKYLDHPTKFVRYEAMGVIANASAIDEHIMGKVVNVLANPSLKDKVLEEALNHGCTEQARLIAKHFRDSK